MLSEIPHLRDIQVFILEVWMVNWAAKGMQYLGMDQGVGV